VHTTFICTDQDVVKPDSHGWVFDAFLSSQMGKFMELTRLIEESIRFGVWTEITAKGFVKEVTKGARPRKQGSAYVFLSRRFKGLNIETLTIRTERSIPAGLERRQKKPS
jgi:hypothetical protein